MNRVVSQVSQELNGPGRDTRVGQEPHRLGANGMQLVLRQGSRVAQRLTDVFWLEIRKVGNDLRGGHVVREEVDDVRHGDPKAANRRAAAEDIRVLGDAIEWYATVFLSVHCSARPGA
jgi:hypothetical protein